MVEDKTGKEDGECLGWGDIEMQNRCCNFKSEKDFLRPFSKHLQNRQENY